MDELSIENIMSSNVLSVEPETNLKEVVSLMKDNAISCMLITHNGKLVGIITERDLVRHFSNLFDDLYSDVQKFLAADIMTKNLVTLNKDQSLIDALVISVANKVRHIPVVDKDEQLCGVITYTDIASSHHNLIESQVAIIEKNIHERTAELEEANQHLHELSMVDPLLGVGNRRAMEIDLKSTHELSLRHSNNYTIVMLDIDYFKKYNDHYGHQAGDEALQQVAKVIQDIIRTSDRVYRYGGEEFLLLLPHSESEGGGILAKRVLSALVKQNIPHCKSEFNTVTASCGIAHYHPESHKDITDWSEVVKRADDALYQAKSEGRNRLSVL